MKNNNPELVDLGLPSGNLWMTKNLGARSETDSGFYYQWGSLKGYSEEEAEEHSDWKTCPFNNGENGFEEEYFKANRNNWIYKNNILRPEYDIVTQTYGKDFKIPTKEDFQELLNNTTSKYIKIYKKLKRSGRLFTSKINGETLFIPFSGFISAGSIYYKSTYCGLWSSNICSDDPYYVHELDIDTSHADLTNITLSSYCRASSISIRGIKEG